MAVYPADGGSATVPLAVRRGYNIIIIPTTNLAQAFVQLPGGVTGDRVDIANYSTAGLGARIYATGGADFVKGAATYGTYIETTDEGAGISLVYSTNDNAPDGLWLCLSIQGTWTFV